jgi:hypothetical protein
VTDSDESTGNAIREIQSEKRDMAAHLTMHEFVCEVLVARVLADMPEQTANGYAQEFVDRFDRTYGGMTANQDVARQMREQVARAKERAANLMHKALRRADEYRRSRG